MVVQQLLDEVNNAYMCFKIYIIHLCAFQSTCANFEEDLAAAFSISKQVVVNVLISLHFL